LLIFDEEIKGITDDSRKVKKGFLFIAIKGLTVDGHKYITQAIANGATVVVGEENLKLNNTRYIKVKNSRKELGVLSSKWYGNPSEKLKIIGVTGTDGKTTTSNLIYWILKTAGKKVGLISTINAKIGNKEYDTGFHVTNPEPLLLQELLAKMVKAKCEYAVLEVTSHGLDQERTAGTSFNIGVLTNITHEHLDYHKTMKNYIAAKGKLFKDVKTAFLNSKNKSSSMIKPYVNKAAKIIKYNFQTFDGEIQNAINYRFEQDYNKENASAAVEVANTLKINSSDIIKAVRSFPQLSGRMEEIKNNKGIKIYVDFAHTPNALERVLKLLKNRKSNGRLISIFGCAGERDNQKRPMMAGISTRLADISIFTAEDPRREDINKIIEEMHAGIKNKNALVYNKPERGEAIFFAINKIAKKGDIVVICGKGHEKSMSYNGVEYLWSDQEAVKLALKGEIKEIKWKN